MVKFYKVVCCFSEFFPNAFDLCSYFLHNVSTRLQNVVSKIRKNAFGNPEQQQTAL